jgi:hypothetical protein
MKTSRLFHRPSEWPVVFSSKFEENQVLLIEENNSNGALEYKSTPINIISEAHEEDILEILHENFPSGCLIPKGLSLLPKNSLLGVFETAKELDIFWIFIYLNGEWQMVRHSMVARSLTNPALIPNEPNLSFFCRVSSFHNESTTARGFERAFNLLESSIFKNNSILALPEYREIRVYLNNTLETAREMFNEDDTIKNGIVARDFMLNEMVHALDCFSPKNHKFDLDGSGTLFGYWKSGDVNNFVPIRLK